MDAAGQPRRGGWGRHKPRRRSPLHPPRLRRSSSSPAVASPSATAPALVPAQRLSRPNRRGFHTSAVPQSGCASVLVSIRPAHQEGLPWRVLLASGHVSTFTRAKLNRLFVGSTLRDVSDDGMVLVTNFESDKSPAEFANIYKEAGLVGGHVIMLGGDPASRYAALEALLLFLPYSLASSFSSRTASLLLQCLAGGAWAAAAPRESNP